MTKGSFLNRNTITKEGNLEYQEERKSTVSKNAGEHNTLPFPFELKLCLMLEEKRLSTVSCGSKCMCRKYLR
jgi:hypothetical protein